MHKQTNAELAKAMRQMADLIEAIPDSFGLKIYSDVTVHGVYELEQLKAARTLLGASPKADNRRGSHWIENAGYYEVPVRVVVHYAAGLLSKKLKTKKIVITEDTPDLSMLN